MRERFGKIKDLFERFGNVSTLDSGAVKDIEQRLQLYASMERGAIDERIEELNEEWDLERVLNLSAASLALTGIALGTAVDKRWLILAGLSLPLLVQVNVQKTNVMAPLYRSLGFRSRDEIELEKYALKALRGDFEGMDVYSDSEPSDVAGNALRAAGM